MCKRTLAIAWCGLALMGARPVLAAQPRIVFADGVLTIQTDRYEVHWQNGSLVAARSRFARGSSLTVADGAMRVDQLPNGLGSFHGHAQEGKAQHHPWGSISPPFAAQHPPDARTRVRFERLARGARLTYAGLREAPDDTLVQELTVETRTGDLVIHQSGHSSHPGVFGIGFSLLNLRPDISLAMPYFGGQTWQQDWNKGSIFSIA